MPGLGAQSDIRRDLLTTAGARALLAALPEAELRGCLRHRPPGEQGNMDAFPETLPPVRENEIPTRSRTAAAILGPRGRAVASVTLVGSVSLVLPRVETLSALLRRRVEGWRNRPTGDTRDLGRHLNNQSFLYAGSGFDQP
jgi:DNA-binding IclR family transcriptional regulator